MQIICPHCNKKFEIKSQLIPTNGRLLQCGNCNHKWFYKKKIINEYKTESAVSEKNFTNHTSKTNDNYTEEADIAKPSKQDRNKSIEKNAFISTVDGLRFRKIIIPGDQVRIEVTIAKRKLNICKFHGHIFVENNLMAEGFVSANIVDRVTNQ